MPETFLTGLPTLPSPEYQFQMTEIGNPGGGATRPFKKRDTNEKRTSRFPGSSGPCLYVESAASCNGNLGQPGRELQYPGNSRVSQVERFSVFSIGADA